MADPVAAMATDGVPVPAKDQAQDVKVDAKVDNKGAFILMTVSVDD